MKYWPLILILLLLSNCTLLNPLRKSPYKLYMANIKNHPYDAIIVPGVPYNAKKWSNVMRLRILWSKFLFEKGYTKNIIYSGSAVHSNYIESRIMGLYAEAFGIPKANIFTEEKAEHSTENVYYSYYLAKSQGFKNIALATDPYQTSNLYSYIKKQNFEIKLLPMLLDTVLIMGKTEPKINPELARINDSLFNSLKQREGFFKRIRGTKGKNINYSEEDKQRINSTNRKK
jgi:hypothetical protein